jgi:CBS domain-containing protein
LPSGACQSILRTVDIPTFVRMYPPFDELRDERIDELVAHLHVEFHPAGEVILQQGGEPARFLYMVRTGAVELIDDEQVLDLLTEGEVFGHPSLLSDMGPTLTCRAHEDTIVYLIDKEQAEAILGTHSGLAFLSSSLRRRVIRALDGLNPEEFDPWQTPVERLVRRSPVTAPLSLSIKEAAELMTRERVSSLLLEHGSGFAILTDRDLRSRVLAEGRSPDTNVSEVMSSPLITVPAGTMAAEVNAIMLERGVHHIPVIDEAGTVLGLVTDTDLMGLEHKTPFWLKVDIERAATPDDVVEAGRRLPDAVCTLVEANVDPLDVSRVIAIIVDTLTRRCLELAVREYGDPPCPWAWLAFGSEARQEQALLTDQDNGLVIDPGDVPMDLVDPYFERLATFVNLRLEEAGIPRCKAGVIASNPAWRHSPSDWEIRFRRWVTESSWISGALTAISFDYRSVAGPLEVQPAFDELIRTASKDEGFVRRLGRSALKDRPPTGFHKDSVIQAKDRTSGALDLKEGGITLVTNLARVYSIRSGLSENRTLRRLHEVAELGGLGQSTRLGLEEAFRLLWQTRLEHQVRNVRQGSAPDDLVELRSLGPLARQGLKDAFRMIDVAQAGLARELGIRR